MSTEECEPSANVSRLIDKISSFICTDDTKEAKFAKLEGLLRLAMDPNKPIDPKSVAEVIAHLNSRMAKAPMCGTDKLAASFGLKVATEGTRFVIRAGLSDMIRLMEDEARSARHLFEMACVKLTMELDDGKVICPSFSLHTRNAHINALRPYGEEVDDHYLVYLDKLKSKPDDNVDIPIKIDDLIDATTGETRFAILEAGKSYSIGAPDRSKLKALLEYCEKSQISIKFSVAKIWIANDYVKVHPRLKIISVGAQPFIIAYEANRRHPTYPLAPGPESERDLHRLIYKLKEWIARGVCAYTPISYSNLDANKNCGKGSLIFQAMLSEKKPMESAFEVLPEGIAKLYYEALLVGPEGTKAVLDRICAWNQDAGKPLLPVVRTTVQKVTNSLPSPNARLILKYVHFVLATKEIYGGNEVVVRSLPKDPWMAAIIIICRNLSRFNLQDVVKLTNGDIYPRDWAVSKGLIPPQEIKNKPNPDSPNRKPNVPQEPRCQERGGGGGPPDVARPRRGQPHRALSSASSGTVLRGSALGAAPLRKNVLAVQYLAFAKTGEQEALRAMLAPKPAFTYQSVGKGDETTTSTGDF